MLRKIISITVAVLFCINNFSYGLGVRPGSSDTGTRADMYAMGQKLFAAKIGPGSINWDVKPEVFIGEAPKITGIEFIKADYNTLPEGWANNPILQETDLIEALHLLVDPADGLNLALLVD